jgi:hypothetical protein
VSVYDTPPEMPDGVLVQSILIGKQGDRAGYRIYADGRYESLTPEERWGEGERLGRERLEAVERAIDDVPLDDLPGRYEGTSGGEDPHVLWMQVNRGGHIRTVSVLGDRRVPELETLTARLTDAFRR